MREAISEFIKKINQSIANLQGAGYMSPQSHIFNGAGFSCRTCSFYQKIGLEPLGEGVPMREIGDCIHPKVQSKVEFNGCCNFFDYNGVHTQS